MSRFQINGVMVTSQGVICLNWETGETFTVKQPIVTAWLIKNSLSYALSRIKYFLIHKNGYVSRIESFDKKTKTTLVLKDFTNDWSYINFSNESLNKFIEYAEEKGYSLKNFFKKLPSEDAIGLIDFLALNNLPITVEGNILAFKALMPLSDGNTLVDFYTKKVTQQVGDVVHMHRYAVDSDRNAHCSVGLHVCTKEYLKTGFVKENTVFTLVKVSPEDVRSVPNDLNSKMRCCKYQILGVIPSEEIESVVNGDTTNTPVFNKLLENAINEKFTGVNHDVALTAGTVKSILDMNITDVHSFALDGVTQTQVSNPTFIKECSENASEKLLKSIQYIDALRKGITVENEEKYLKRLKKLKKKVTWKALKVEERLQRRIQRKWKKYGINQQPTRSCQKIS